ncbi:aminoglycoside phosphotransferase family protein [Actinomadura darangshiensis]|uniref:Aminoglycoside phosphotransferase family protein n=1 Tax=Actinomadura darangshiensis TaxID=705336 RepID=A0A4R4ZUI5_9ACTN|nr:aminoglycoside phosphotransferase family protein [Actinomadura darangshiensis]
MLAALVGRADVSLLSCRSETIVGSSGAATGAVSRVSGMVRCGSGELPFRLVRKEFRPVAGGRHAAHAGDARHWAYWRREPLAYASGLLPTGPGLAAPRCYGVVDDVVYLADVEGAAESPRLAARRLGAWQAAVPIPDVPWLAGHQLAQRMAVSDLDWSVVDADPRIARVWRRRGELLDGLTRVPPVLTHGDFSAGNLIRSAETTTVVLDWATLGAGPVGADLASLALSTGADPLEDYLAGLDGRFDETDVATGYRTTLALTGAGRVHWMLSRGMRLPDGYEDFILAQAPPRS